MCEACIQIHITHTSVAPSQIGTSLYLSQVLTLIFCWTECRRKANTNRESEGERQEGRIFGLIFVTGNSSCYCNLSQKRVAILTNVLGVSLSRQFVGEQGCWKKHKQFLCCQSCRGRREKPSQDVLVGATTSSCKEQACPPSEEVCYYYRDVRLGN